MDLSRPRHTCHICTLLQDDWGLLEFGKVCGIACALRTVFAPQDVMPTDAFEAMAKSILASNSCLKRDLPVIVTQLHPLLAFLPGSETAAQVRLQPRGQPALPTAEAMRRGADLVAAAASHVPAFEAQVPCTAHLCQF